MNTITVRARLTEKVANGIGYPESVTVTGGKFLSRDAVQEMAQEAIDSMYGEYESSYMAIVNTDRWNDYRAETTDKGFIVPVIAWG